jgi:hypothetical protein
VCFVRKKSLKHVLALSLILRMVVDIEVTLLLYRVVEGAVLRVQRHFIKEGLVHS